jgi:hypothetical protein
MRVERDNLVFDDANPKCKCIVSASQGKNFAFVQALDIGMEHARLKKPIAVRYWGEFNPNNPAGSLLIILNTGSPWPRLPR